jgi:hypothetical protein
MHCVAERLEYGQEHCVVQIACMPQALTTKGIPGQGMVCIIHFFYFINNPSYCTWSLIVLIWQFQWLTSKQTFVGVTVMVQQLAFLLTMPTNRALPLTGVLGRVRSL